MELAAKIKSLMKERGTTQKELSKSINITEAAMSRYLSGSRTPRIDVLVNIARYFNVSVEYLTENESEEETQFKEIKRLVARNANKLTDEEKLELLRIISKG